jgi:hypothetical protein
MPVSSSVMLAFSARPISRVVLVRQNRFLIDNLDRQAGVEIEI